MATKAEQRRVPERILVVSLDNIGDLVFASALLPPLRQNFPAAHIAVWCKDYASGLGPLLPAVDEVFSADPFWDRSPGAAKGSLVHFLRTAARVRRGGFDTAILCFAPWRTAAAVAATGIPERIGLARRRNERWLTRILQAEDRSRPVLHEVARLLEVLDITSGPLRYRLDISRVEQNRAAPEESPMKSQYVALHPFAGSEKRCVRLSEWVGIATELASIGIPPLWIGTTTELDRLRSMERSGQEWLFSDEISGGSLTAVAVAISRARLFIGHDSGPLHIAAALCVPAVGVFAPGEPARTFPQGEGPWRIIVRNSPLEITARLIVDEARALLHSS